MSQLSSKRQVILFETFMTHCMACALGMVFAAFARFGVSSFAAGAVIFFLISFGLQRLAASVAKSLTLKDRAEVALSERIMFTIAGILIPPFCMAATLLLQG
jgi:hypothetical protein